MTAVTRYMRYIAETGQIESYNQGYWADEAAALTNANYSGPPGAGGTWAIYVMTGSEAVPDSNRSFIQNGVIVPIPGNSIALEIDGVAVDLAALGIDPVDPPLGAGAAKVQLRIGQQVKIKNIPAGTTYNRKDSTVTTTAPLTTVSWKVAKTGNNFETYSLPTTRWWVLFEVVA